MNASKKLCLRVTLWEILGLLLLILGASDLDDGCLKRFIFFPPTHQAVVDSFYDGWLNAAD